MKAFAIDERSGRESFFTAAETTLKQKPLPTVDAGVDERPVKGIMFGDKTELNDSEYAALRDLGSYMDKTKVAFKWQAGDALVINNSICMHSRDTFKPPRRILASLSGRLQREPTLRPIQ